MEEIEVKEVKEDYSNKYRIFDFNVYNEKEDMGDDENNEIHVIFVVSEIKFSLFFFPFCIIN
jgi:hypothetical protein